MSDTTVVWFRQDLRLADHAALRAACARGAVVPLYIWAPDEEGTWPPGGASRVWLHQSLQRLAASLAEVGSRLILRSGPSLEALRDVVRTTGASAVYWSRRYEPASMARDKLVKAALREDGIEAESFNGSLLHEPWTVTTKAGEPCKVFTPFWRTCVAEEVRREAWGAPEVIGAPEGWPRSEELERWALLPEIRWDEGIREAWTPGEQGAHERLGEFVRGDMAAYDTGRNRPDEDGSSRLSPHLHFGELSPQQVWAAAMAVDGDGERFGESRRIFLAEVGWREFAYHLLYHFPHTAEQPLREQYCRFRWAGTPAEFRRWTRGQTGVPLVDAAMRDLWRTGWMPNRPRMVVASFLTKNLLVPWQDGAGWFWDTLVDADLASNSMGWQWTAGCGADAAPYFRIFNPVSQAEKFDPKGDYIRRWVPELAALENKALFAPWTARDVELRAAGVRLGETYPEPLVDLKESRQRALDAYAAMRQGE